MLASGVVTSASLFGALLGSIATFLLKDRVGRRSEMFISASCYGAQLAGTSHLSADILDDITMPSLRHRCCMSPWCMAVLLWQDSQDGASQRQCHMQCGVQLCSPCMRFVAFQGLEASCRRQLRCSLCSSLASLSTASALPLLSTPRLLTWQRWDTPEFEASLLGKLFHTHNNASCT